MVFYDQATHYLTDCFDFVEDKSAVSVPAGVFGPGQFMALSPWGQQVLVSVPPGIGPGALAAPNILANITSFEIAALMLAHVVPISFAAPCTLELDGSPLSNILSHALSIKFAAEYVAA